MSKERFLDANIPDDMAATIRPRSLGDFIGHDSLNQNLSVFISGARSRGEAMDHVLLELRQRCERLLQLQPGVHTDRDLRGRPHRQGIFHRSIQAHSAALRPADEELPHNKAE